MRLRAVVRRSWVLLLPAAVGCGTGASSLVTVTDSAGVRITLSVDSARTFAVVDTPAILSLGGPDAVGPTQFGNIQGVRVDARGNVWVADGQSAEVRIFLADGSPGKTVGGRGEGPGEFQRIRLLGAFRGDSVAFWDDGQGRLTVLDAFGQVAKVVAVHTGEDLPPNAFRVFEDGTVLARLRKVLAAGTLEPGTIVPDTAVLARVDLSNMNTVEEGGAPAPRWLWTGHSTVPIPFTSNPGFDLRGDEVHVTSGTAFRIRVFEDGRLVASYGVDRAPDPVTEKDKKAYADMVTGSGTPSPRSREYLSALDDPHLPELMPSYRSLVVAEDGNVWAERYSTGRFDVFGVEGGLLGQVDVPAGLTLTQVTDSTVVGVWRDPLYVEYVRVYPLRK